MTTPNTPPAVPPQARFFQWVQGWASLMLCHSLVKTGVIEQMAGQPRTVDEIADARPAPGHALPRPAHDDHPRHHRPRGRPPTRSPTWAG
ncbi:hypothetical protein [Candidatus Amarolinea dominans]|uniref:hypothetical protein n=1 Tax=Candidatus Amarolinea dominans TaxID=3140696 RepID=UPI00313629CE|nr:hypothetical protein [Anaerolineae bacterium]